MDIKSLRIYPRIARNNVCYVSIFQKQKTFCKWPSLAAWWSGVMTTTGNGIFVCYYDNQQQQPSMACHAMPCLSNINQ